MEAVALTIFGIAAISVLLLIVLRPLTIHATHNRKTRIREWAAANGWTFQERAAAAWTGRLPGHNRRGIGVMVTGRQGRWWVTVAEYSYETTTTTGDTTTTTTHRYIVTVVHLDRPHPWLAVRRRGLMSQFGRALFGDKPTATGNVLFDAQFRIDAADPAHAKAVVSPALVAAHISGTVPFWSLVGNELLTYTPVSGRITDPRTIPAYAGHLLRVADLLGPVDLTITAR